MTVPVAPLHMGALHPLEQLIVLAVAFGPFLVLFVVVYVVRRRAIAEEAAQAHATDENDSPG
jgi:hypothetical protein